jgi:hypothetical protein
VFGWALLCGLVVAAGFRIAAVFTENVNWDEFALLQRALATVGDGELRAGGRPGLGTLALVPFAAECLNAVEALRDARIAWTVVVLLAAAAFWLLLRQVLEGTSHAGLGATLGLALWTLPPPFLMYSVQVRTDQPAILLGMVGGLALLRSRRRSGWAVAAGVLFGIGFLFTQKLLYVGALVGLLSLVPQFRAQEWQWGREIRRGLLAAMGFAIALASYRAAASLLSGPDDLLQLGGGLRGFAQYRTWVGWEHYIAMLPLLVPHLLILALLPWLTVRWWHRRQPDGEGRALLASWAVVALGTAIAAFHAGRFPYFFMTLGLFPAAAGAILMGPMLSKFRSGLPRAALLTLLGVPLLAFGLLQSVLSRADTQSQQIEGLAFLDRSFSHDVRGFSARSEFVCRRDPDPFPTRFTNHVRGEFGGDEGRERGEELVEAFRQRQVAFMLMPRRQDPYPDFLWDFWRSDYVPYHGAIRVAGRRVEGDAGWRAVMNVIAPGVYVWRADEGSHSPLVVGEETLHPGDKIPLEASLRVVLSLPQGGSGLFVLSLPEDPTSSVGFYRGFVPLSVPIPPYDGP